MLGGTFVDLPVARSAKLPRNALRFDPAAGLFGLVPARSGGILDEPEVRQLLSQAIDREALIAALDVPGLAPRATVLEGGLANVVDPRSGRLGADPASPSGGPSSRPPPGGCSEPNRRCCACTFRKGPGSQILFDRLRADWGALGIQVERARSRSGADLKLIDQVAPSTSAAWFLRRFRCGEAAVCDEEVDELLDNARSTQIQAPARRLPARSVAADRRRCSCSSRSPRRSAGRWCPAGSPASPGTASPVTRSSGWRSD